MQDKKQFAIGDRVMFIADEGPLHVGDVGTIIGRDSFCDVFNVRWDEYHSEMHTCAGACEDGHGWNVEGKSIIVLEEEFELPSDNDMMDFLFS